MCIKLFLVTTVISAVFGLTFIAAETYDGNNGWGSGVTPKPGECPPSNSSMHCFERRDLCQSDCQCRQKQKCCFQQDCGYSCKEPTVIIETKQTCSDPITATKPGTCPPPDPAIRCFACIDQCTSDCECPGEEKCCPQPGCGNSCKNATRKGPCKKKSTGEHKLY